MSNAKRVLEDELEVAEEYSTPNWPRELIFENDGDVFVLSKAPGGTTSGWHHHGDRDVYVFHLRGSFTVEYADGGSAQVEPGMYTYFDSDEIGVHRYVVPEEEDEVAGIVGLIGSGPAVVNVDGPDETPE